MSILLSKTRTATATAPAFRLASVRPARLLRSIPTLQQPVQSITMSSATTFYDFAPKDSRGNDFPMSQFKDKVVLVVNVASQCGFTRQYAGLESLYKSMSEQYPDQFTIIGFPCNQFGGQEPASDENIQSFCSLNYGVSFPVLAKVNVKGGSSKDKDAENAAAPVWKWLTSQKGGTGSMLIGNQVLWNFEKFLIGRDGEVKARWRSVSAPSSLKSSIVKELEAGSKPPSKPETKMETRAGIKA